MLTPLIVSESAYIIDGKKAESELSIRSLMTYPMSNEDVGTEGGGFVTVDNVHT